MNRVIAAEVFPPGEFVREELEARGWTQEDLSEILGVSLRLVNEIINGKRSVTPDTAKALANAFETDAQYWMTLESMYQLWRVRPMGNADAISRRSKLYSKAPVKEMIRRNWIEASDSIDVLERRVLDFFGIGSLDETPQVWPHAARKSTAYNVVNPAQAAWLFRARHLARGVHATSFSPRSFTQALRDLRNLLANPEDIRLVPRVLANAGIRLVILEHLAQTRIDGACLWLDPKSPAIVLSMRYDRIDALWYPLMHEMGHVKNRDGLDRYAPVDIDLLKEGVARQGVKPKEEEEADRFATEFLLPQDKLHEFIIRMKPLYSARKIVAFASLVKVHPGIVVGQLQHRGEISYAHSRKMLVKVRHIITQSALTDGWGHTPPSGLHEERH